MVSIRKRLLVSIFSIFMLFTVALSIVIYIGAKNEVAEVYDENMKQVAIAISGNSNWDNESKEHKRDKIEGEEEFLVQVWKNKSLQYTSHSYIKLPLQSKVNYSNTNFKNQDWRVYAAIYNNRQIQIAQLLKARNEVVLEIIYQFIFPFLILLPIMLTLIYLFIGKGLKPLISISDKVAAKNENNFSLIDVHNVPKEIFSLVQSLNQLLARLEIAFHKQKRFTADAAHELRTPLTAVKLQLDILERADNKQERQSATQSLRAGVDRSINLVKSLLLLARNEPEGIENYQDRVDFKFVIQEVADNLKSMATKKNIKLILTLTSSDVVLKGQKESFVTLVENLIQNSILYSKDNGRVEVDLGSNSQSAIFKVSDNGIGISPSERERVFDRFYRVLGTKKAGSGLGLAIVKNIVDYYNGEIEIEDGLGGKGCCLIVHLPIIDD